MKKICLAAGLLAALSLGAVQVDGIAATVGSQSILRSEVVNELRRAGLDESRFGEVLNRLIDHKLIVKAAADAKMTMQEWLIDNRVREIVDSAFDGDRNKLIAALAQQKLPYPEWRQRIKDDMVVGAMRWNMVDKNVSASPAEMREEFKAHPERYAAENRVTASVILLKPEDAEKRDAVLEALKTESFADVARKYSADSHAEAGGLWKDIKPEETFRPEVCAELVKMPKGTLSPWIDLSGWSFLVRKEDETGAKAMSFAEAYDEIEANVKQANAKRLYQEWLERLKAETYIKIY